MTEYLNDILITIYSSNEKLTRLLNINTDRKPLKQLADLGYFLVKLREEYQNMAFLESGKPFLWGLNLI